MEESAFELCETEESQPTEAIVVNTTTTAELTGSVDITRIDELLLLVRRLADEDATLISIDCTAVTRFDGAAMQLLIALQRSLTASGRSLVLCGVTAPVMRILASAGMDLLFAFEGGLTSGENPNSRLEVQESV